MAIIGPCFGSIRLWFFVTRVHLSGVRWEGVESLVTFHRATCYARGAYMRWIPWTSSTLGLSGNGILIPSGFPAAKVEEEMARFLSRLIC